MRRISALTTCLALLGLAVGAPPASAQIPIFPSYGSISGTVTDASGNPLARICVTVLGGESLDFYGFYSESNTTTGEDGTYRVADVDPGTYKVRFSEGCYFVGVIASEAGVSPSPRPGPSPSPVVGYITEWYDDKPDFESADPVEVHGGADTPHIDAALTVGGKITGKVTNAAGEPLGSICVGAYSDFYYTEGYGYTGGDGAYRIVGLRTGGYKVEFRDCSYPPLYLDEWYNDKANFNLADPVGVTVTVETPNIDAVLAPAPVIDLAVTGLSVENVPIQTDYGQAGYTGWVRRVHVEVSNLGEAVPEYASVGASACTTTDGGCRQLGWIDVRVGVGGKAAYTFEWNGFGQVGDATVEASVYAFRDRHPENNSRRVSHYVIVGGTGFGFTPCWYLFC